MKTVKTLAAAAALSLILAGGAQAAEKAMACCAKCECCKDKDKTPDSPAPTQSPPQDGAKHH